jgi:hypothetical protein
VLEARKHVSVQFVEIHGGAPDLSLTARES